MTQLASLSDRSRKEIAHLPITLDREHRQGELRVPFNRSSLVGRETEYIAQAIAGGQIAGDQAFSRRCHAFLEQKLGVRRALLTTSCTHALEMAAMLLEITPGDEVIVPSFTFVSTANAFALRGARPVLADVRPDTLNLDETKLESLITSRTRAIVPMHYGGVACETETICDIAHRHGIAVIEDNAHGLFGRYRGQALGTFGAMATLSFHETKNFTCGEGGALLINDPAYVDRAEIIREKGTDRSRFFRGQVDKYSWVDIGSSYLMSDLLAAFLYGQLEQWETVQARRQSIWQQYDAMLADWAEEQGVRLPIVPGHCRQAYHLYYLLAPSPAYRHALMEHLRSAGILSVFHYQPLHLSEMGQRFGGRAGDCPVAENVSDRLLRLPMYYSLSEADLEYVIASVCEFSSSMH
jgi:dTDP-4-amino-4,6-dideoxygalactose transaminase